MSSATRDFDLRYIHDTGLFNVDEDIVITPLQIRNTVRMVDAVFSHRLNALFMERSFVEEDHDECFNMESYPRIWWGLTLRPKPKPIKAPDNIIQKVVFYFLRAPVYIGACSEARLSRDRKPEEYLDFLHAWVTKLLQKKTCLPFLQEKLNKNLPKEMIEKADRKLYDFSAAPEDSVEKLRSLLTMHEVTKVRDYLDQLLVLAQIVHAGNVWTKMDERPSKLDLIQFYDEELAWNSIQLFGNLLHGARAGSLSAGGIARSSRKASRQRKKHHRECSIM